MSFLSHLNWRYATKRFDTSQKVSEENLENILEAIRLTPTSFGLQPYHFYVVTSQEIKEKIQTVAWNQPQMGTSSHLLVFAVRTDLKENKEEYFHFMSGGNPEIRAALKGFEDMVDATLNSKDDAELFRWASKQVYIALGFALAACAELEIDSCPMEGFDPAAVGEILDIPASQKVLAILPIGYRDANESPRPKVRFTKGQLFTKVN